MPSKIFSFNPKYNQNRNQTPDNPANIIKNASGENQSGLFGGLIHKGLFIKNLTRFWPLWFLASLTVIFPLSLISGMFRYGGDMTPPRFTQLYYETVCYVVPIVMLSYAIICAMCVWGYLYNSRAVGMMHSLPIRRESLFFTNFLSGLAMIIIPCLITGGACVILSILGGAFDAKGLLITVLCVAGEGFFYFTTATAAAFLTGNIAALPLLYFFLHFLQFFVDTAITAFATGMIFGLSTNNAYTGILGFFSPTIYLMRSIFVVSEYDETKITNSDMGYYTDRVLKSVELKGAWIIGVYVLIGLILLYIAWLLYKYRRSESAGDVIAVSWGKPVFQYGVTALMAIGGGQILYIILVNSFDEPMRYALIPMILCMIAAGALGYYSTAMMLAKSLRVFTKSSLRGLGAVALGCVIFTSVLYFDIFGVGRRVPETDQLIDMTFRADGNFYLLTPGKNNDSELIEQIRDLHRTIIQDQDYILNFQPFPVYSDSESDEQENLWDWVSVSITYSLKSGKVIERYYPLYITKDRVEAPETYDCKLNQLLNSRDMKYIRLRIDNENYILSNGSYLTLMKRDASLDLNSREAARLWDAVRRDADEGTWGNTSWFRDEGQRYAMQLMLRFRSKNPVREEFPDSYSYDMLNIHIWPDMRHTLKCLRDLDLIQDDDLITIKEMNKIWQERDQIAQDWDAYEYDHGYWEDYADGHVIAVPEYAE